MKPKPKYGYYCLKPYLLSLSLLMVLGFVLISYGLLVNHKLLFLIGIAIIAYAILTTAGWWLARYLIPGNRIKIARKIAISLDLSGSELILDVGSGRGLFAIEVAKILTKGKVIGIDLWESQRVNNSTSHHKLSQPTGNTISNARKNARIEGVEHKIEFLNMDATQLNFDTNSFDLTISGFVINHLWEYRFNVLKEIHRILKPGGRLILIDNYCDLTYFFLSTPHLFVLSYLRGKKAKMLTKKNWIKTFQKANFNIIKFYNRMGIIVIESNT